MINKEKSFKFSKVRSFLIFDVYGDGWEDTVHVEVGCGEDIQMYLELLNKKQWDELFEKQGYDRFSTEYAIFKGFQIACEDEEGNKFRAGNDFGSYGAATLNIESFEAGNAQKLNKIREVLNS